MLARRLRLSSVLVAVLFLAACHPNYAPELIPAATKLDVVHNVNLLMDTTIDLENQHVISTDAARIIIKFCVVADQTIQAGPTNWKEVLKTSWSNVKANNIVQPYLTTLGAQVAFATVDALIGGL